MSKLKLNYLIAISACAAIVSQLLGQYLAFSILKPLTSVLVILLVVVYRQDKSSLTSIVIIGLIACLGGDVLLLDESLFAYGLSSFVLAHLLFTYLFYSLAKGRMNYAPLIALLLFAACFYSILLPKLTELTIPVAVYQLCISVMCWQGINLYLSRRDQVGRWLCIAGLLFVFSDTIIAVNKFLIPFELSGPVILLSYWLSIALIANVFTFTAVEIKGK
ncbi:MAG: putative membrane protein YhhN [Arenicella sp.]|jgi:uncharacterized membrane protein YhhN